MISLYISKIQSAKIDSEEFIRFTVSRYLDIEEEHKLSIAKNPYGKPYLVDYPDVHFNISHTRGAIACAISDFPVGVDIENIRKANFKLMEYYFELSEREYVFSGCYNVDRRFTEIWTKKEAYLKFIGTGISIPISKFDVLEVDKQNIAITMIALDNKIISICTKAKKHQELQVELISSDLGN